MADNEVLRHLLIVDWANLENTPPGDRIPDRLYRWKQGVERLASAEGRNPSSVVEEIKMIARNRVDRERQAELAELARDLAVDRALGKRTTPPWQRRLAKIARIMDLPLQTMLDQVEQMAARVRVDVML